jgi:hypothetical protein
LAEIRSLPEQELSKVIELVRSFRKESLSRKPRKEEILKYAGLLSDLTEDEKKVFDQAVRRRSLFSGRELSV